MIAIPLSDADWKRVQPFDGSFSDVVSVADMTPIPGGFVGFGDVVHSTCVIG